MMLPSQMAKVIKSASMDFTISLITSIVRPLVQIKTCPLQKKEKDKTKLYVGEQKNISGRATEEKLCFRDGQTIDAV